MPIQAPQWTDYLNCPVCCREFGAAPRTPISLKCGHTLCRQCINNLHRKQCPFDQTVIQGEPELVVNTALLQLAGFPPPAQPYHPPSIQLLSERDKHAYDTVVRCMEHLSLYLKYCSNGNNNTNSANSCLSRPMQRKLVTLLQCAIMDEEGRGKAVRAARSLGERTVTELILQHQNPQKLSANLWASVRARGCQFLGPAMQEEVLKLVLLALEDGSALSRKVLVMFVVQRLEPHFPQASKTSIGHVVQLLYRASCFKVSKRECDSSLMQLKEEFRTYESLRREHDAQIVQIATEAGLRIAPDQWSALLYGDTAHKSHMQSIIDKLQTPQSFSLSIEELFIALHGTGDPARLVVLGPHLGNLASIDPSPEAPVPSWTKLAEILSSLAEVVAGLAQCSFQNSTRDHNKNYNFEATSSAAQTAMAGISNHVPPFKTAMCRDVGKDAFCPRGTACKFAHTEEELESFRNVPVTAGNFPFAPPIPLVNLSLPPPALPLLRFPFNPPQPVPLVPDFVPGLPRSLEEWHIFVEITYYDNNFCPYYKHVSGTIWYPPICVLHPPAMVTQNGPAPVEYSNGHAFCEGEMSSFGPPPQIMPTTGHMGPPFFGTYLSEENAQQLNNARQQHHNSYQFEKVAPNNNVMPVAPAPTQISPYDFDDLPPNPVNENRFLTSHHDPMWSPDHMFDFEEMRNALPCGDSVENETSIFSFPYGRDLVHTAAAARGVEHADRTEDFVELEESLQALERYIDFEYKSAD